MILCVDNHFINLTMQRMVLEMAGYKGEIKCFQDSTEAIKFIKTEMVGLAKEGRLIDMIISDVSLPRIDGLQMFRQIDAFIKQAGENLKRPILFMYAPFSRSELSSEIKSLNIEYFVGKPLDQKFLKQVLQQHGLVLVSQKDQIVEQKLK